MQDPARMYVAVRADIPIGLQMAQAIHASFGFAHAHPALTEEWLRDSQYLIVVNVPDEQSLMDLVARSGNLNNPAYVWHEPDRANEATAVALAPGSIARYLCANLPLAGRETASI